MILAAGGRAEGLNEARDCLVNVDALGEPIPTARFMGGREYAAIAGEDAPTPTLENLEAVLTAGAMAWPSFAVAGGPFQDRIGRLEGTDAINAASSCGPIIVEPLAAFRPTQPVSLSQDRAGTVGGALALAAPDQASLPRLTPCRPLLSPRLGPYRRAWRTHLKLPQQIAAPAESPDHQ